ncbi:MAG TPA: response regulator transcription factor [Anaerolineae bacterium]|nr:response regulator transcription factor [Anaerolineae bacterium]
MDLQRSKPAIDQLGPKENIRVLIVDDHAVVRQGLRTFLELHGALSPAGTSSDDVSALPIEVVGEAANGAQAVDLAGRFQPDVVLLDLVMPGMDGIQATPRIVACSPHSRVIILTSFGEEDKVIPAVRAGAQGYLLKDIPPDELARAVRAAYLGQVQLHPDVARKLMSAVAAQDPPTGKPGQAAVDELTGRELEVLGLIARGFNNREIAETMVISEKTVKTHVSSILGKLHLEDRTQAAIYALRHGLAPDEG